MTNRELQQLRNDGLDAIADYITELESKSIDAWLDEENGSSYPEGVNSRWEKFAYAAALRSARNFYNRRKANENNK